MTGRKIVCIGDSLTEGFLEWGAQRPYTDRLAARLGPSFSVENHGVSGETTAEIKDRIVATIPRQPVEACVILGGTNDICCRSSPDDVVRNLLEAANFCRSGLHAKHVVVMTLPEGRAFRSFPAFAAKREAINERLVKMCSENSFVVLDFAREIPMPEGQDGRPFWGEDGLHMTAAGYDRLGDLVFSCLSHLLGEK